MPSDKPTQDEMRYAVAQAIPQNDFERAIGTLGGYLDKTGKFITEATSPIAKSHPVRSWLAENLVAAPLRNAGTAMQDWTNTPREITEEQPYTPAPFYGGSKATLNPHTWGPALQSFKTDPRVLDVAGAAQVGGALARKAGAPVARAAGEALNARMLAGESLIPGMSSTVAPSPLMFAVKPKGGNWLNNQDVEVGVLAKLKKDATGRQLEDATTYGYKPETNPQTDSVNRWVDKKLGTYIRNEMGTPEDPVRLAHEKGFSHIPGDPVGEYGTWLPEDVAAARVKAGYPEEGFAVKKHADAGYPEANQQNTYKGEMWENLADIEIATNKASKYQDDLAAANWFKEHPSFPPNKSGKLAIKIGERNPWLSKVSPDTPVYHMNDPNGMGSSLGFDHLVDELRNTVDPASGLPQHLRWKPQDLDKVTMQQAVERVSKINDWRAEQAAKAEREGMMSNLTAAPRLEVPEAKLSFVEKPGMKWVDIPETTSDEGLKLCTTIGKQGGWCTQGEGLAKSYGSKDSRLTALLDSEGRPHAQAKITETSPESHRADFMGSLTQGQYDAAVSASGSPESMQKRQQVLKDLYDEWSKRNPPKPNITELKPVGNDFSSARAAEYEKRDPNYKQVVQQGVLDFLNKGDWGKVNDLGHYDIFDLHDPKSLRRGLEQVFGDESGMDKKYIDLFNIAVDQEPNANRFMNHSQLREFVEPTQPKAQGYRKGGVVKLKDGGDASAQFYSQTFDNPDSSKTTESGIVKQFEEDYMKFALQRHEQPKRNDIANAPAPATQTNIYGEYGTPAMGGMVSGRVTKMGAQPDTYMGDLNYRTPVGPGMATVGVTAMRTPEQTRMANIHAGYGVPLGQNGFVGANVMQPTQGGKPIFGAQLQYRKQFAKGGAVTIDEMRRELMRNK